MNTKIKRDDLDTLFGLLRGEIFSCVFTKVDNTERLMVARKGVRKYLKGGVNHVAAAHPNLQVVFDMQKKGYRMVNKNNVYIVED
jgi:hypothetical protein